MIDYSAIEDHMRLYHWRSEFLAHFGSGTIVTLGVSVEEARAKARQALFDLLHERGEDYLYDDEEFEEERAKIIRDLAVEPTCPEVVLIPGSE